MITTTRTSIALYAVLLLTLAAACGGAAEQAIQADAGFALSQESSRPRLAATSVPVAAAALALPAPAAPAAPAAAALASEEVVSAQSQAARAPSAGITDIADTDSAGVTADLASLTTQRRIIVRTVDMRLVVADIAAAIEDIGAAAVSFGGWVVSTSHSAHGSGSISVRVPASELDAALANLRAIAKDVPSEISNSQDFTEEYVDLDSRISSLKTTEQALQRILDDADSLEHTLGVFRELKEVRADIEVLQGRLRYLETTSAFSLINIHLELEPLRMPAHAGDDATYGVGETARFRAIFMPPEGIDTYNFSWDFGDGTPTIHGSSTARTTTDGERITATVTHTYTDDIESPYIVQFNITGSGSAGIVKGEDTFIATVAHKPVIDVFIRDDGIWGKEEGKEFELTATFTVPSGVTDLRYEWDFGDGSPSIGGSLAAGETRTTTSHTYANQRPEPYIVTMTVTGDSEVGDVETTAEFFVSVVESQGLIIQGWNAGEDAKDATRFLSGFAQAAGTLIIWVAINSPVLAILGGVLLGIVVLSRRYMRRRTAQRAAQPQEQLRAE